MTRCFIIDTNVVVAALLTAQGASPTARILDAMLEGTLPFLLSPALLTEYRAVLLRPRITRYHGLGEDEIDVLLTELVANALWREPTTQPSAAPDPGDDHLWALLAEPESILITGDRLLLAHAPREGSVLLPLTAVERFLSPATGG